jgi:PAS domain S-box-containing protein
MRTSETFEVLGLGFIEYNEQGEVTQCNNEAKRILGTTFAHRHLLYPDKTTSIFKVDGTEVGFEDLPAYRTAQTAEKTGPTVFRQRLLQSESDRWIKMRASKHNANTWLEVEEVTYEKNEVDQLLQDADSFKKLVNSALESLMVHEHKGTSQHSDGVARTFYGWSLQELCSMLIHQIKALTPQEMRDEVKRSLESNQIHFQFKQRKSDGFLSNIEVLSTCVEIPGRNIMHAIIHDVTSTFQLQERFNLLSRAVESSAVSIVITDAKGSITYVNPYFTKVSGYSYEESIGKNPRMLKSGLQSKAFYKAMWNTIASGKDWQGELQNRRKDNTLYWEKVIISPIADEQGNILHFVAVKEDITMMRAYYETIEMQNRALKEIAWIQSHELRAPLVKIMGLLDVLTEKDFTLLNRDQILEALYSSSEEIDTIIRLIAERAQEVRMKE